MIRRLPVTADQSEKVAELMTAARPDEPQDPEFARWWLERPVRPDSIRHLALWESGGRPVAYTQGGHLPWDVLPERFAWMEVFAPAELVGAALLGEIQDGLLRQVSEDGPKVLDYRVWEDAESEIVSIERRGFARDRLSKAWELDLAGNRQALLAARELSRSRMVEAGILLTTLAADPDPDSVVELLHLINTTKRDIPTTHPMHDETLEELERWLGAPVIQLDRYWIAREHGELVGVSYLQYPPVRGNVWTGYTASLPSHRGRGIAKAVKLETLGQAVELGVHRVRTDNDEQNGPMLHINEALGYRRIPGILSYLKRL